MRNLQKGAIEMSSKGPKMVIGTYGLAVNGLKWPKNQEKSDDPWWPPSPLRWPYPGSSSGDWPRNFTDMIVWRSCFPLASACCRWLAGDASFGPNSAARKWVKTTQLGLHDFWRVFPRVLELKMVFWGLGFHLAPKFMFI